MSVILNQKKLVIYTNINDYPNLKLVDNKKASGFPHDLNQTQFETLVKFKQTVISDNLIPNFDYYDDIYLLKFLRARKFDLKKTIKMFNNYIVWHKNEKIENIDINFRFPEKLELKKYYPHGYHKVDKSGRPIYFQLLSKLNIKKVFEISSQERLMKYFIQEYEKAIKYKFPACSKVKGTLIDASFTILDMEGVGITDLLGDTKQFLSNVLKIGQDYYPENLAKMIIINANRFFGLLYSIAKNFIDQRTVDKIEVLGTNYKEKLFEFVDSKNLPTFLGGECTCSNIEGGCLYSDFGPWNPDGKLND